MAKTLLTGERTSDDIPRSIPIAPRDPVSIGQVLADRYELLEQLGAGGMGVVYRAHDRKLGEDIALKVIVSDRLEDARAVERLQREVKLARKIGHVNVCRVFDFGESEGIHFLTMELIEGRGLRQWVRAGPLPVPQALDVLLQVARALAAAHAEGIVHRDLKPENVLLRPNGQVKVLDFGIARRVGCTAESTSAESTSAESGTGDSVDGGVVGTPLYMAPEQINGGLIDGRTDQFAWGVLAYELLTGKPPWTCEGTNVLTQILSDVPAPVRSIRLEVPEAVSAIIARALAKEPEDRFRSIDVVITALQPLVAGIGPYKRMRRRSIALGAGVVSIAIVIAAMTLRSSPPFSQAPPLSVSAPAAPTPSDAVAAYRKGLAQLQLSGGDRAAESEFNRAVALDPSLAEAHLQLAALCVYRINDSVRDHFRKAEALRSSLSPRDQAFLDAIAPVVRRQPSDWGEAVRRLEQIVEKEPHDAQIWYMLGTVAMNKGEFAKAVGYLDKALAQDPGHVEAIAARAWAFAYLGRFDEAREALQRCAHASSTNNRCFAFLAEILARDGACSQLEDFSRQLIADGELATGYRYLAMSLAAAGRPAEAIREADKQWTPLIPEWRRVEADHATRIELAAWVGDFEEATRHARAWLRETEASRRQDVRGKAYFRLMELLSESGRTAEAGQLATDFLARKDALEQNPAAEDYAIIDDRTPELLLAAHRAGLLDRADLSRRRTEWLTAWERRVEPFFRGYLWIKGYATIAATAEDAREALEALPRYAPIPQFTTVHVLGEGVGAVYVLGGKSAEALPWLKQATGACNGLRFPLPHMRSHFWLGRAREATGDTKGACAAYEVVLRQWAQAKPMSVTAEKARQRSKALKCATK